MKAIVNLSQPCIRASVLLSSVRKMIRRGLLVLLISAVALVAHGKDEFQTPGPVHLDKKR